MCSLWLEKTWWYLCFSHPNTFVKCEHFATLGRMQPFAVSISTNAMMLMVKVFCILFVFDERDADKSVNWNRDCILCLNLICESRDPILSNWEFNALHRKCLLRKWMWPCHQEHVNLVGDDKEIWCHSGDQLFNCPCNSWN